MKNLRSLSGKVHLFIGEKSSKHTQNSWETLIKLPTKLSLSLSHLSTVDEFSEQNRNLMGASYAGWLTGLCWEFELALLPTELTKLFGNAVWMGEYFKYTLNPFLRRKGTYWLDVKLQNNLKMSVLWVFNVACCMGLVCVCRDIDGRQLCGDLRFFPNVITSRAQISIMLSFCGKLKAIHSHPEKVFFSASLPFRSRHEVNYSNFFFSACTVRLSSPAVLIWSLCNMPGRTL